MCHTITDDDPAGLKRYWLDPEQNLHWPSVFVLPDWLQVWWQVFGSPARMMVRTVKEGAKVIGIAPLMVRDDTAFLIGDPNVCDYLDFIITPGRGEEFFHLILEDLKKNGIRHLDLRHLRPDSIALTCLAAVAEKRQCPMVCTCDAVSLEIELPLTWDGYLASLSSKQRHEVRRKLRRLSGEGDTAFCFLCNGEAFPEALEIFFRMFVESRQDKAVFLTEKMRLFFTLLAEAMARSGLLKLGLLKLEEHPLAEILCFDYGDCLYLYNSGFDPAYQTLSAGLVCKILAIKSAIGLGKKRFDFLKGTELYKYQLGGKEVPLYRCQISIN